LRLTFYNEVVKEENGVMSRSPRDKEISFCSV